MSSVTLTLNNFSLENVAYLLQKIIKSNTVGLRTAAIRRGCAAVAAAL
jgi:hypothetical protein